MKNQRKKIKEVQEQEVPEYQPEYIGNNLLFKNKISQEQTSPFRNDLGVFFRW